MCCVVRKPLGWLHRCLKLIFRAAREEEMHPDLYDVRSTTPYAFLCVILHAEITQIEAEQE